MRRILWAQGYSTRLDVSLAYDFHPSRADRPGKAGLTDLDVLGVRLLPGFRSYTAVADCKTSRGGVPERLFWLSGVGTFFGSDNSLLVRAHTLPQHAIPLARALGIAIVGPEDLEILLNTYPDGNGEGDADIWREFFSPTLLGETLLRLARLPNHLGYVETYRDCRYWMESPYTRLQRSVGALQELAKDGTRSKIFRLVFADFVWLYVVAIWRACGALASDGLSRVERGLSLYLSGNEEGLRSLQQAQQGVKALLGSRNKNLPLAIEPPYFPELLEVVGRCLRRPEATARMARRAEWLMVGQMVGGLGPPPWQRTSEDSMAEKLLGDVARFLVQASGLDGSFLEQYLHLLGEQHGAATGDLRSPVGETVQDAGDTKGPPSDSEGVSDLEEPSGPSNSGQVAEKTEKGEEEPA
jgi:hypothetical protein